MSTTTPDIPGNGGSLEKATNELLDIATSIYQMLGSGGLPVDISGTPPAVAVDFATPSGPTSCFGGVQTVTVGDAGDYNQFNLVSVMFDSADPRDVTISIVVNGSERTWVSLTDYTGPSLLLDDKIEGPGFQLRITIGQHSGSFTSLVSGKAR